MPEQDIEIRYGFINGEKASELLEPAKDNGLSLKVFPEGEDFLWRNGSLIKRAKKMGRSIRTVCTIENMRQIDAQVAQARGEGQIPIRVNGPLEEVASFSEEIGLTELELTP